MSTPAAPQPSVPGLPDGLTVRPLALGDARAAYELLAAEERHDLSAVEIEEADVLSDWQRPSWNISTGTVGVFADADLAGGPPLVGYAEITGHDHGSVAVHPDHRGRGIGTALAHWTQAAAAAHGMGWIGMPVPRGSPGDRLLESLGYEVRWTSWLLELPAGTTLPERPLPAGHAVREARADELEAVWEVNEDAFLEWSERDRTTFSEWRARIVDRPGYEPWHLRVCVEAGDAVVGMLLLQVGGEDAAREAHVDRLAVRADRRGHGLGQALLVDGFAAATGGEATRCTLGTDSRTGARALYERVGMRVVSTWVHRGLRL